jgi:acetyl esterase
MPLHPQARKMLDDMAAAGAKPNFTLSVQEARDNMLARVSTYAGEPVTLARVEDRLIPGPGGGLPVRLYWPENTGILPAFVYFHGGGWVVGSVDTHDHVCRAIAKQAGCLVVSVEYRRAPEFRFPAAAEDAYAATAWVASNAASLGADPARVAVGGDSAGGNLATVVCLMAREKGGPRLVYQVLWYPVTDFNFDTPSYLENAEGLQLWREDMIWFWRHYLGDPAIADDPLASPLRAKDLRGLPPALVITAEYDPLRDEGEAYAARLREADVRVEMLRYEGMIHGFISRAALLDLGKHALDLTAESLRKALAPK